MSVAPDEQNQDQNKLNLDKNNSQKPVGGPAQSSDPVQIDEWIISSPEKIRIIGCGGPGNELVEGIFKKYSEKLAGLQYHLFDKPTKPDYLDLRLTPDYRNIHAARIKKEIEEDLNAEPKDPQMREDSTQSDSKSEPVEVKVESEDSKVSIFNKLKKLLSSRPKSTAQGTEGDAKESETDKADSEIEEGSDQIDPEDIGDSEMEEGVTEEEFEIEPAELGLINLSGDQRDLNVLKARAELKSELEAVLGNTNLLFIITDLQSTYGLDNSLIAAKLAKQNKIITIGLVFLPPKIEKLEEVEYSNRALHSFRLNADIIIAIPYMEDLLEGYLVLIISELLELITTSGLVNLDVADIKTVVGRGNVAMMGFGAGSGYDPNKIMEAINEALTSPLLQIDLNGVSRTLVNVTGDNSMTITEAQKAAKVILGKIQPDARLIWGAAINPKLSGSIKVMIMAGISPKNILVNLYANS
ncbi:MAG: hypothetical protein JSV49_02105 [Thermoplasmata archaeon]|nr:MAG: hypothetical protein JSV49_02105 [Thermoplasmata archaeon]